MPEKKRPTPSSFRGGGQWQTQIQKEIERMPAVSDQSGWLVTFVGMGLSYLLSIFFLGSFSSHRVTELLNEAIRQSQSSVQMSFETAGLVLRDGILPRFRVRINGIKISSADPCVFAPRFSADQADLPLSWIRMLLGKNPVQSFDIQTAELRLKTERGDCVRQRTSVMQNTEQLPNTGVAADPRQPSSDPAETLKIEKISNFQQSQLAGVEIGRLRVFLDADVETFVEVEDLNFDLGTESEKTVSLWAKIHLFKEQNIEDYFTHGVLQAHYRWGSEPTLNAEIRGHVREGSYLFKTATKLQNGDFEISTNLDHVPFAPLLRLLQRLQILETDFPAKKVWATFKTDARGNFYEPEKVLMTVHPIEIIGEIGHLSTREILVKNLVQPTVSPFSLMIKRLDLDQIADQVPRMKARYFHQLGVFEGVFKFLSLDHIEISGIHNGLELIFSNGGQREVQTVQNILIDGTIRKSDVQLSVSRVDFVEGLFQGSIQYQRNEQEQEIIKISADEIQLSPRVQKVMTSGGNMDGLSFSYERKWKQENVFTEQLQFVLATLKGYGLSVKGVSGNVQNRVHLAQKKQSSQYELKAEIRKIQFNDQSELARFLEPISLGFERENTVDHIEMFFEIDSFDSLRWKNVSARAKQGIYRIEGGWNREEKLMGQVDLLTSKRKYSWSIEGNRSAPQFRLRTH